MKKFIQSARNVGLVVASLITVSAFAATPPLTPFSIEDDDAEVLTVVKWDSMEPYADVAEGRVSFFSVAVFTKDTDFAQKNDRGLILSTVKCENKTIRRTLVKITRHDSKVEERLFQNDDEIARSLQDQDFRPATSGELPEVRSICRNYMPS